MSFNAKAHEFVPSWGNAASIPSFTPSFDPNQNGMYGRGPQVRTGLPKKSKPITLASLGVKTSSFSSTSLSHANAPAAQPAAQPVAQPVAQPAPQPVAQPAPQPAAQSPVENSEPAEVSTPAEEVKSDKNTTDSTPTETSYEPVSHYSLEEIVAKEDPRDNINVVFIGHVDAGKSTICGNIMYSTGLVDKRTIEKYEREAKIRNRESWFLAYIMDTNDEERAKGITVEVGRAYFATEHHRFTVLDAPGHKNYVPNMIAGAAQADVGVLVISARKGEFEAGFDRSGQTREHVLLAKTLGVKKLVVAINKMDEETVKWSESRFKDIVDRLSPYLKSVGYNVQRDVTFLPTSGIKGYNLKDRAPEGVCPWYNSKSLFEILDEMEIGNRDPNGPLRLPVLDKFNDRGCNITGKVEGGRLIVGDNVILMPNNRKAEVASISINEEEVLSAKAGDNVNVKLKGISDSDVFRGDIICHEDSHIRAVKEFEAQLSILELLETRPILTAGYGAVMHIHTAVEECTIGRILAEMDRKAGTEKKKPRFVRSNTMIIARITLAKPLCLETYDVMPQLGRFSIRDEGKTIAIGKVTKIIQ